MNISYDRDGSHNYLVSDAENIDFSSYEYNMLESNDIDGILSFDLRRIDGKPYLYYKIDSMQSLRNRYGQGKLSYEKLRKLTMDIVHTLDRLSGYFLDEDRLVIDPECIFEDLSKGQNYFLYMPDFERKSTYGDMVMELIDTEDEKAVELAYRISEAVIDENASMAVALRNVLFEEGEKDEESLMEPSNIKGESENAEYDENLEDEEGETESKVVRIKIPSIVSILMSVLFTLVAGVLWYIRVMYYLTIGESIIDLAVLMLCVMMSLISLLISGKGKKKDIPKEKKGFFIRSRKHAAKKDEEYDDDEDADSEGESHSEYVMPEISTNDVYSNEEDCEETVLLGHENRELNHKLYSNDKELSGNIDLAMLPLTIGKFSNLSDVVLKDPTVSRIHARVLREDGEMYIQDLNSKNGTFINGKRLLPNEKMVIIPDDEIAFGKCSFAYR